MAYFKIPVIVSLLFFIFNSCGASEVSNDIEDAFDSIEQNMKKAESLKLKRDSLRSNQDADSGVYSFDRNLESGHAVDSLSEEEVEEVLMNAY